MQQSKFRANLSSLVRDNLTINSRRRAEASIQLQSPHVVLTSTSSTRKKGTFGTCQSWRLSHALKVSVLNLPFRKNMNVNVAAGSRMANILAAGITNLFFFPLLL